MILAVAGAGLFAASQFAKKYAASQRTPKTVQKTQNFDSDELVKYQINDAKDRLAVCNDGSPGSYFFRPGNESNSDKWIIHLKGGGSCGSEESCANRWETKRNLMTSKILKDTMEGEGILSNDPELNPDFYNFNHVYVYYCSSDTHSGDSEQEIEGRIVQFRGQRIIDSLLEDLKNPDIVGGKTLEEASEVLLTGSSAGGNAVIRNLETVVNAVPDAEVKAIDDSGWNQFHQVDPYAPTPEQEFVTSAEDSYAFMNSRVNSECVAANSAEPWVCQKTQTAISYYDTPIFLTVFQRDSNQLGKAGIDNINDSDQKAYVDEYARLTRESMDLVDAGFCSYNHTHTSLTSDRFNRFKIDDITLQEAIGNWYFDRSGPTKLIEQP